MDCCGRELTWVVAESIYDTEGRVFRRVLRCPTCEDWRLVEWKPPTWVGRIASVSALLCDELEAELERLYPAMQ